MPEPLPYILATAGHVDHGKSAIVRALTGTDPDRLPEEKARGITIDLGFAHLLLGSPPGVAPPGRYQVGVVDVPGHEDFVKNMVAGVGSVDVALLVVAADDGWMPQTEEHVQILGYLGVTRGVVCLSKIDLAADEAASITAVRARLVGSALAEAPIVATSVVSGRGIEELKAALARVIAQAPPQRDLGKPRLPLDRVFSLKGIGTVVTGTLTGGSLRRGDWVIARPTGRGGRARTLQTYNREVERAAPGSRVALNLPDLSHDDVARGQVITLAELGGPCETVDVLLERSARLGDAGHGGARPLKSGALVQVHHGSGAAAARVFPVDAIAVQPRQRTLAQLRFDAPAFVFVGDRFVIRDWPGQHTLAGGVVLDVGPARRGLRDLARRAFLDARAAAPGDATTFVATLLARDHRVAWAPLLVQSRFAKAEVDAAVASLTAAGQAVAAGAGLADASWWAGVRQRAAALIEAEHRAHPERAGLALPDLRQALLRDLPQADTFEALLGALAREGFVRAGTTIRHPTHRPALPPRLAAAGERLRAALAARPFDPPSRKELTPDAVAQQAMKFLLINGEAVEVGPESVLAATAMTRAIAIVRQHIRDHGPATVSELKTALGSSRRIMVPLLEKLDRDGITRREGDKRVLR